MVLFLYQFLFVCLTPFLYVLLLIRRLRGLEERGHVLEKTGRATLPRPNGRLIWLHAASVGEMLSAQPLVERLLAQNPDAHCLITTVTVTSARLVKRRNNPRILHQYMPLDTPFWMARFLAHWRPDAVIWLESEIWPCALSMVHKGGIPLCMVNGRLSPRSAKRWGYVRPFIKMVMGWFDVVLAQTAHDQARLSSLGATAIAVGNMKFAVPPLPVSPQALEDLRTQIGARPVLLMASTHAGEEDIAADVSDILRQSQSDALLIVMPRHPDRGAAIRAIFAGRGITVAMRSQNEAITPDTRIYLADTLGEAGLFYTLSPVAFVGNSLITVPGGGHNLLEPAHLDCAILHGPHMWNFTEIDAALRAANGSVTVQNAAELAREAVRLFNDAQAREALALAAKEYVQAQSAVLDNVCLMLRPVLTKGGIEL